MGILRRIFFKSTFEWKIEEWRQLGQIQGELDDEDFLQQFKPLLRTFHARKARLNLCAEALMKFHPPQACSPCCKILEIASGCDVLPGILRSKGYDAVGLDSDPLVVRYCRLKNIKLISPETWDMPVWTGEIFNIVILVCYVTGPTEGEWSKQMLKRLCENILHFIRNGMHFYLFDLRWFEPVMKEFERLNLSRDVRYQEIKNHRIRFYSFIYVGHRELESSS